MINQDNDVYWEEGMDIQTSDIVKDTDGEFRITQDNCQLYTQKGLYILYAMVHDSISLLSISPDLNSYDVTTSTQPQPIFSYKMSRTNLQTKTQSKIFPSFKSKPSRLIKNNSILKQQSKIKKEKLISIDDYEEEQQQIKNLRQMLFNKKQLDLKQNLQKSKKVKLNQDKQAPHTFQYNGKQDQLIRLLQVRKLNKNNKKSQTFLPSFTVYTSQKLSKTGNIPSSTLYIKKQQPEKCKMISTHTNKVFQRTLQQFVPKKGVSLFTLKNQVQQKYKTEKQSNNISAMKSKDSYNKKTVKPPEKKSPKLTQIVQVKKSQGKLITQPNEITYDQQKYALFNQHPEYRIYKLRQFSTSCLISFLKQKQKMIIFNFFIIQLLQRAGFYL